MPDREPLLAIESRAIPVPIADLDTDQILPARFLKLTREEGLGQVAFRDLRFDAAGSRRPDFPLNDPRYVDAHILIADENFGSGSSREAAVYALYDYGVRCVIAPSFGAIFYGNALRNGLLPVRLPVTEVERLQRLAGSPEGLELRVDLQTCLVHDGAGEPLAFSTPALERRSLLTGKDELELTLDHQTDIDAFVAAYEATTPWVLPQPR